MLSSWLWDDDELWKPIRKTDGQGRLVEAGFAWGEFRPRFVYVMNKLFWLPLIPIFHKLWIYGPQFARVDFMTGVYAAYDLFGTWVVAMIAIIWLRQTCRIRKRSLIFRSDGAILAPEGFPDWPRHKKTGDTFDNIGSLAAEPYPRRLPHATRRSELENQVRSYGKQGEILCLARFVSKEGAHMVAVQLSNALEEMRRAIARPHYAEPQYAEVPARQRRVIN